MHNEIPDVVVLTLLNASSFVEEKVICETKVWVCVRNRSVNRTHPDIVSVPTQRIPSMLAEELLTNSRLTGHFGDTELFDGSFVSNETVGGGNPTIYAVEALLSGKLGVSAELERRQIGFTAALAGRQVGFAIYPELKDKEHLRMLNVVVKITRGSHLIPANTVSYSTGRWVSVSDYFAMWRSKDVTRVGISAREALNGVCVDGLCISSTYDILASYLGGQPEIRRSAA